MKVMHVRHTLTGSANGHGEGRGRVCPGILAHIRVREIIISEIKCLMR